MQDNDMWAYVCTGRDADLEDRSSAGEFVMLHGTGRGLGRGAGTDGGFGIGHGMMEDCAWTDSGSSSGRGRGSAIGHGTLSKDGFGGDVVW